MFIDGFYVLKFKKNYLNYTIGSRTPQKKHGQTHSNFAGDAEKHGTLESTPDKRVEMKDCVLN